MNLFNLFKKKTTPLPTTRMFCVLHGEVPTFHIAVQGINAKRYPACGHCIGEMASKFTREETL